MVLKERVYLSFYLQHSEVFRFFSFFKLVKFDQFIVFLFIIVPSIILGILLLILRLRLRKISVIFIIIRQLRWLGVIDIIVAIPFAAELLFVIVPSGPPGSFVFLHECGMFFPLLRASIFYDFLNTLLLCNYFIVLLLFFFVPVLYI